ncbi:hypothetical protein F5148DRAFT_209569 [Russula earlei]|uniref:Uncharacterized protein n=1 Tax=Russula earlei TaxID=71964 RepID=A0ACC0U4G0_9AGAM|nr:hypothetical protein F5148DRAFT_209569 [Russula earlei]
MAHNAPHFTVTIFHTFIFFAFFRRRNFVSCSNVASCTTEGYLRALPVFNPSHVSFASCLPSVPLQQHFCCAPRLFGLSFVTNVATRISHRERELSTIEVMFLSFRRSRDVLLALGILFRARWCAQPTAAPSRSSMPSSHGQYEKRHQNLR